MHPNSSVIDIRTRSNMVVIGKILARTLTAGITNVSKHHPFCCTGVSFFFANEFSLKTAPFGTS